MVIYSSASTLDQTMSHHQPDFDEVQQTLSDLKLVLNAEKTKLMMFTKRKSAYSNICSITTLHGSEIEVVSKYKYLGFLLWYHIYIHICRHLSFVYRRLLLQGLVYHGVLRFITNSKVINLYCTVGLDGRRCHPVDLSIGTSLTGLLSLKHP